MTRMTARPALIAAITCSAIGVAMSAVASIDRSVPGADRVILAAANIGVTLAAHMLLSVTRRPAALLVWVACVGAVVYGHVTFVAGAMTRAGQGRADAVQATAEQTALTAQLTSQTPRPAATVAAQLADVRRSLAQAERTLSTCTTRTPGRCATAQGAVTSVSARVEALQIELTSAQRADTLRDRLSVHAADTDQRRTTASADPAAAALAALTGLDAHHVQAAAALTTAVLIELLAVVLWQVALPPPPRHDRTAAPDWTASTTHHALATPQAAAHHPSARPADPRDRRADAGRGIPGDTARARPADRLHRAGTGCDDLASDPAHRPGAARPDHRQQPSTPAQARRAGHRLGDPRPSAVDTG